MSFLKTTLWDVLHSSPRDSFQPRKSLQKKRTILLSEDDNDLRYVMECTFNAMGYDVVACADAQVASSAFRSRPAIDILLTDFEMPGRSGVELARELTGIRPSLPVMIITGTVLPSETLREIEDKGWIYIAKPCRLPSLEATLERVLLSDY